MMSNLREEGTCCSISP